MVMVPGAPAVLSKRPLGLLKKTRLAFVIGVPSGFTFTRKVLTLSTISPAGAGAEAPEVVTRIVRLLSVTVSAVMTIGAGIGEDPPTAKVSTSVLLSMTSLARSVVPGAGPEIVTVPGGPAVLSGCSVGLPISMGLPSMNDPSGFQLDHN